MIDPSEPNSQHPTDVAGFLHRDASGDNPLLPDPPDAGQDERMESMQRGLVERIAAVDDERRRSAAQTQRALETQREEVALQMRRQRLLSFLTIGLMILLTLAVVGYGQWQLQRLQAQIRDGVTQASEAIAALEVAPPAEVAGKADADEVERLSGQTETLATQVGVLRDRLAAAMVELTELKGQVASQAQPPTPEPPSSTSTSSPEPADIEAETPSAPSPSETDARSIDELLETLSAQARKADDARSGHSGTAQSPIGPDEAPEQAEPVATAEAPAPTTIRVGARPVALQLVGFRSRELVDAFIVRNPLPAEVYTREETFRGRPWFVLIHSLHPDRASARDASDGLPPGLAALDLWIRELPEGTELEVIETASNTP
jgi:DamX protein